MLRCVTAILLAFELFAATFIQIPAGLVQRAQLRSAYRDGIFSELPADSSNKDLSFSYVNPTLTSNRYVREIEDTSSVVYDDLILIANLAQLLAIGTDRAVTDTDLVETQFGEGEPVFYADGTQAVYASAASYYLCNDIPLPQGGVFALPEDFSGMFCGAPKAEETVYDPATDTVYIGSIYQLEALASAERETMPVVSGDLHPDTFGVGSLIFPPEEPEQPADGGEDPDAVIPEEDFVEVETGDSTEPTDPAADDPNAAIPEEDFVTVETGAPDPDGSAAADFASQQIELMPNGTEETDGSEDVRTEPNGTEQTDGAEEPTAPAYLTYSSSHNYVLSSAFTAERAYTPAMLLNAPPLRAPSDHVDGRDYFGQVSVVINGETYILIGDRQQLDAINDDATIRTKVCGPVFKATEGSVEVYRIGSSGLGDWIWLSEFDGSKTLMDGNGYGTTAAEVIASYQNLASGATVIYPGDADLIDLGADGDFSESPLYDKSSGSYHGLDRPGGTATSASSTREVYFTTNSSGVPDLSTATLIESAPTVGTLTYTKDGKYIVFRDIDMTKGALTSYGTQWKPLMFTGIMYGVKAPNTVGNKIWDDSKTTLNLDTNLKPEIYNFTVTPVAMGSSGDKLNLDVHVGVGFFATLTGKDAGTLTQNSGSTNDEFDAAGDECVVRNLRLRDGSVNNPLTSCDQDPTLVSELLRVLSGSLTVVLEEILKGLTGTDSVNLDMLSDALNARKTDPTNLATGAFAGRIIGNVRVEDCEVLRVSVTTVRTDLENPGSSLLGTKHPKIVGKGGFVGHAEGVTSYTILTKALGQLVTLLESALNYIPYLGLGDLITLLLKNLISAGNLLPTGYTSPRITRSSVVNGSLSDEEGKYGVGGFAGSLAGVIVTDCKVKNCKGNDAMTVKADYFGGGFAGVARDGVIKSLLSGLSIDTASLIHPQSELIRCSIENCDMTVTGGTFLGGFSGVLANSYGINDTIDADSTLTVTGTGDYIGGYTGRATLGSIFGFSDYLEDNGSLLGVVKQALTSLLSNNADQTLLDLGGVAAAAILGFENHAPTAVASANGSYAGGIVGRGEGTIIAKSDEAHLRKLSKYSRQRLVTGTVDTWEYRESLPAGITARDNQVTKLISVSAGKDYAGGIAGHISTASIGGLLGNTVGLGEFVPFEVSRTYITGIDDTARTGYTVQTGVYDGEGTNTQAGDYAGGAFGWAVGGKVEDVELFKLAWVKGNNHIGGFVGTTGPGNLASGGGLSLTLFGLQILEVGDLLKVVSSERTTYLRANVTGIPDGYTVEQTGRIENNATDVPYSAGGYAGDANSVRIVDCHANKLKSVIANGHDGAAGGFVARSAAGDIADLVNSTKTDNPSNLLSLNQVVNAVSILVPSYDGCDVNYVDGGFVQGDTAGGFAGDFRSGKVNTYTMETMEISGTTYTGINPIFEEKTTYTYTVGNRTVPWSVNNIHHVRGGHYAGGWGGHVYPGALASAGGGLNILGVANTSAISADDLLGVADVYIPIIKYAGVNTATSNMATVSAAGGTTEVYEKVPTVHGFTVYAAYDYGATSNPATDGYAGGFIGYGQSVQISYSSVSKLAHGNVTEPDAFTPDDSSAYARIGIFPDELESQNGGNYINYSSNDPDRIPYAVAGAYYAGGYIGHMDIGSAASVGDKLKLLGSGINLNDVLSVLDVVVSTIEHSHVEGMPGGFNVMASPRINLHNGTYGDADGKGVSYSGGFAGKISGGHIQDSNCVLFAYIIGEIAAGGYVGEMAPGTVANVLPNDSGTTNSVFDRLLSLPSLAGVASLLEDFVPTIRNSETSCIPCGGAVRAESPSDRTILRGMAGGYVGHCVGGQIWGDSDERWKDDATYGDTSDEPMRYCTAHRIRSVYGREYAGGYAGFVEAGSTADVGSLSVLSGLLNVDNLLGALNATYAKIKRARVTGPLRDIDEQTWNAWKQYIGAYGPFASELYTAAYADLDNYIYGTHVVAGRHKFANYANTFLSGCAGGFVGAMHSGVMKHCEAIDTKLVLGMRAAGGFVGEMQTGDLAKTGGVSLLGQNINLGPTVSNLGSVLVPAVEDSRTEGYSYGLQVGATGSIGIENIGSSTESSGTTPSGTLADGYYLIGPNGWTVNDIDPSQKFEPNPAHTGEYMLTTSLAEGNPVKVVKVEGGAITTWYPDGTGNEYTVDAAHAGRVYIYFTPTSKSEWTAFGGYIYIEKAPTADDEAAFGKPSAAGVGCAGGFVGAAYGGQLTTTGVYKLKRVKGVHAVGGYAGMANSAALVSADTNNTSDGILQNLLDALISNKGGLVDALHATVCTINEARVESLGDADGYGFVVDGAYEDNGTKYAPYAGGFAGMMQATLVNTKKGSVEEVGGTEIFTPDTEEGTTTVSVKYLRGVNGGHYAGGFAGLASVGSVAQIGGSNTNILSLLNVGNVGLLDIFRTYIYRSTVEGVEEGIRVFAHDWEQPGGSLQGTNVTGAAGGFAGGLMSGTIEDSSTTNLNYVEAPNYAAGYCGHSGTKSVLNLSGASVDSSSALGQLLTSLGLDLSTSLQLMNIIGSTFKRDTVTGFGTSNDGFIVKATETQTETSLGVNSQFISGSCAAGFAGYADIAQIEDNCQALKIRKIIGPQIAGGFVGRTSVSFLAEANVSDSLVRLLTTIVRELLRILGINALSNLGLVDLGLNDPSNPLRELLGLELLNDGKLVQINLFGLVIAVAIAGTDNSDPPKPTLVTITIGSSMISLPVNPDGTIDDSHLQLQLIELNRTAIRNGLAQGIDDGYDVFGNGADQNSSGDPDGVLGYSGGFIGLNDHGFVSNSETQYCDTVRGAANKTGPFVGGTLYNQNAQGPDRLEENSNNYHIYRGTGATYSVTGAAQTAETVGSTAYNRYRLAHLGNVSTSENADMAYLNTNETAAAELLARQSNQKFVGMLDAALADNPAGLIPMPGEMKDPCDTEMKITLQKVWDDEDNLHNRRPNHVNFTIAVVEAGHTPPANVVVAGRPPHGATVVETKTYTLYPGDTFSNTWPEKVVTNLNHGTAGPDPNDASATMYYQFYVYETEHYQASYSVSYAVDEWAATVIATNTDWLLPETGGVGTTVFVILGVALLIAGALMAAAFWINRRKGGPSTRFGRR